MNVTLYVWDENTRIHLDGCSASYQGSQVCFDGRELTVHSAGAAVRRLELEWEYDFAPQCRFLSDQWERAYGNMGWKSKEDLTVMPWYFLAYDGETTHCFGVKAAPGGFCWWRLGEHTVSLFVDISCGCDAVQLNGRTLSACQVVMETHAGEPFAAARVFCAALCPNPRLPATPVYGGNDWYCNYGHSSYEKIVTHARRIVECAPEGVCKPYMVVDDGWELCRQFPRNGEVDYLGGPWQYCNRKFGDMKKLADEITAIGAIPGIWFRPLLTTEYFPDHYFMRKEDQRCILDPSLPEVLDIVREDVSRLRGWGYRLIKHDFSTMDIVMKWGSDPEAFIGMSLPFAVKTKTTAEIILDFYQAIRDAAGDDTVIIGCNTLSHLSAGLFEIMRTGDDTSGVKWSQTKEMGVNALAFRMCQHGAFYACDADCVGITNSIPWQTNRKWLDVVAKSGTPLFVSIAEDAFTDEVKADLKIAFAKAAANTEISQPLDWLDSPTPCVWKSSFGQERYDWDN